jgi:hypothetical protein
VKFLTASLIKLFFSHRQVFFTYCFHVYTLSNPTTMKRFSSVIFNKTFDKTADTLFFISRQMSDNKILKNIKNSANRFIFKTPIRMMKRSFYVCS